MKSHDTKQHDSHPSSAKPAHTPEKPQTDEKVALGVTTNPHDVGAGGGSTPLGEHGQDSRTWNAHDNQKNQEKPKDSPAKPKDTPATHGEGKKHEPRNTL